MDRVKLRFEMRWECVKCKEENIEAMPVFSNPQQMEEYESGLLDREMTLYDEENDEEIVQCSLCNSKYFVFCIPSKGKKR